MPIGVVDPFELVDVVEHQRAVLEMTPGQLVFDEALLAAKPIEGGVDLGGGLIGEARLLQKVQHCLTFGSAKGALA